MASIPVPQWPGPWPWTVAVASVIVGVALLLWGDKIHRVVLTLAGVGLGAALGGATAPALGMGVWVGRVVGAVVLGLVGLVAARLIWALMAMGLSTAAVGWVLASRYPAETPPDIDASASWLGAAWQWIVAVSAGVRKENPTMLLLVLLPVATLPLLVALIRPRLGRILMTSLLGGAGIVFALLLVASRINPTYWDTAMAKPISLAIVVAVLMLGGLTVQYIRAMKTEEKEEPVEASPPAKKPKKPTKEKAT